MTRDRSVRTGAVRALALAVLAASGATPLAAQRAVVTSSDAVKLVVVPFARQDRDSAMAVQVANAMRERLTIAYAPRFNTVSKRVIDTNLVSSGFPVDMPLDPGTARQLARVLNARLLVEGVILQLANDSVEVVGRLSEITGALPQTASASLRLERRRVNNGTGNDLANRLAGFYRSFENTKECVARRQANEYDRAIAMARAALERYPNSSQAYLCMAQVMQAQNAPADSVILLLERARDADSLNVQAMWQLAAYFEQRHDTTQLIYALRHIISADPSNVRERISAALLLNSRGHVDSAIAVLDSGLMRNPNLADILVARSAVLAGASRWAEAGADLARAAEVDTTKADSAFVVRITGIYQHAADTASLIQWVDRATQRFPTQANYWYQLALLRRARNDTTGAVTAIRGFLERDPNSAPGHLVYASYLYELGQYDSAYARALLAERADSVLRPNLSGILFGVGARRYQARDADGAVEALTRAKAWGVTAPRRTQGQIAFFLGAAQFMLVQTADSVANASSGRDQTQARCDAARRIAELINEVEVNITAGGSTSPDAAQQILTQAVPAYRQRAQAFSRQARCPS